MLSSLPYWFQVCSCPVGYAPFCLCHVSNAVIWYCSRKSCIKFSRQYLKYRKWPCSFSTREIQLLDNCVNFTWGPTCSSVWTSDSSEQGDPPKFASVSRCHNMISGGITWSHGFRSLKSCLARVTKWYQCWLCKLDFTQCIRQKKIHHSSWK